MKTHQAKQGIPMGSVRWEAAYRLSLVPWASRPRAWAPRVSSLITISDGLGPISNPPHPPSQHAAISSE